LTLRTDHRFSSLQVHFIFRHKNPKTGEYEEKHLKTPPVARTSKVTSLYTLIVKPDQTFEILINGESAKAGSLLEDFTPAVNPEKEIDDPKDKKPADWVDEVQIADPEATKPADWDEEAPFEIPDEDAEKPADWLDDEPTSVPDPEAEKPEDWDDEEDGDWLAPTVPNPKCAEVSGCGEWTRPMIKNPEYKGKWSAPMIDNPAYKGPWAPRKIANPGYYEDKTPSNMEPMGAVSIPRYRPAFAVTAPDANNFRRLVSRSGPCRTTSCLTTSISVTPSRRLRRSARRPSMSSSPLRRPRRRPASPSPRLLPPLVLPSPSRRTPSLSSARRSTTSLASPRRTPSTPSRPFPKLLAVSLPFC
jgi:hypothetical protein